MENVYVIRIKSRVNNKIYCIRTAAKNVFAARVNADSIFREKHGDKLPADFIENS